jgi:hypothetical protein
MARQFLIKFSVQFFTEICSAVPSFTRAEVDQWMGQFQKALRGAVDMSAKDCAPISYLVYSNINQSPVGSQESVK